MSMIVQTGFGLFIHFLFDPLAKSHKANLKHFGLTAGLEEGNIML